MWALPIDLGYPFKLDDGDIQVQDLRKSIAASSGADPQATRSQCFSHFNRRP